MIEKDKKNNIALESEKTKKAREKLKKQFLEIEKKITPEALKQKSIEIHRWISRYAQHRVTLKNKNISLFDENQNTAEISRNISSIFQKLKSEQTFFSNNSINNCKIQEEENSST
jgi:hypothetical protein